MILALIFGVLLLLLLASDAYIVWVTMAKASCWARLFFLLPTVAYVFVATRLFIMADTRVVMQNLLFWLTLCVVFPTLFFAVISLLGKLLGLWLSPVPPVLDRVALCVALCWIAMSLYGILVGWKKITVDRVELAFDRLPASFAGYRIVHLSDFHIGTYALSPETVRRIIDEVNGLHPDLIVFTGDLVNMAPEETDLFADVLKKLRATDGVISVLGNHDYCLYRRYTAPDSPHKSLARLVERERDYGWRLLRNEHVEIARGSEKISVVGVENAGSKSFPDRSDLSKAVGSLPSDEFKILLSHDPTHWRREVLPATDIDLTLSGHTHAMQFRVGSFSPSRWVYKEWGGVYAEGRRKLVVSTGTGGNIAFRFGAYPQIILITLDRK